MFKFNQNAWLEPSIDMNTNLRKKVKNDFEVFQLMNNAVFGKSWKMREKIEILNLSQQKEERLIYYQSRVIILQIFSQKIC